LCRLETTELARPDCIAKAAKRRAFSRALRRDVVPGEVEALLSTCSERARIEVQDVGPKD